MNNNGEKNNKTKKNILIAVVIVVILLVLLCLIGTLSKSPNNSTIEDNRQNQANNNTTEDIINGEEQSNNDDSYLPNTDILKRSLEQTSKFDNGISIKVTNSIEYADDDGIYHKPMFIKVELSNGSNKNFYQGAIGHGVYSNYTENPVEYISDDFNYTNFEIQPMYLVGNELKTERCGCVLRKTASTDTVMKDENGKYNVNYFVLKPGEKTTAYLLCYFREEIEGANIKTIYLYNNNNKFMYFMD